MNKADCGVVVYANHAKKRPHNLTFARFYDGHVLDLLELGLEAYQSVQSFASSCSNKVQSANKVQRCCVTVQSHWLWRSRLFQAQGCSWWACG